MSAPDMVIRAPATGKRLLQTQVKSTIRQPFRSEGRIWVESCRGNVEDAKRRYARREGLHTGRLL